MDQLAGRFFEGYWVCDWTTKPRPGQIGPVTHFSYSYAAQCVILDEHGTIERIIAAHDAGRVMNPTLFEGQIEGAIHMGLGYAVREEFIQKDCRPVTTKLGKCGILRSTEMPVVDVIPVEVPDLHGPYGAKGVGEIGLVPTAGAVGNALFHYDGRFRRRLPFRERILRR
jgi:xanthine dehydrogenase molybdenum-binding subunit